MPCISVYGQWLLGGSFAMQSKCIIIVIQIMCTEGENGNT